METPIKPDESDCCNSGCNPCILDVYEEQLKKYNKRKDLKLLEECVNSISPTSYSVFKVVDIEKDAEDSFLFSFEYVRSLKELSSTVKDDTNMNLFYKPGQYFLLKAGPLNNEFTRAYTPIPTQKTKAKLQFTILVKLYEYGRMSKHIRHFKIGTETSWRGAYGNFSITYYYKHMLLIAQGSGIAPLYSIICDMVKNEDCFTFIKLFYCCKNSETIYLRNQLYELQSYWNFNYEIYISNNNQPIKKYNEIVHSKKMEPEALQKYLSDKNNDVQVLICGSESFMLCVKECIKGCKVGEEYIYLF